MIPKSYMSSVFYLDDGLAVREAVAVLHPHHLQVLPPPHRDQGAERGG